MSNGPTPKSQTVIPTPAPKVFGSTVKTYGNSGMKCVLIDGMYYLQNAQGQTISKKNTMQEIDNEHTMY